MSDSEYLQDALIFVYFQSGKFSNQLITELELTCSKRPRILISASSTIWFQFIFKAYKLSMKVESSVWIRSECISERLSVTDCFSFSFSSFSGKAKVRKQFITKQFLFVIILKTALELDTRFSRQTDLFTAWNHEFTYLKLLRKEP